MLSKSQLIEKVAVENEGLSKKQVKGVIDSLATVGYKELGRTIIRSFPGTERLPGS